MAAAIRLYVSELRKLVTCCLCNDLLKQATCLSCNHHFCMACILEYTGNTITSCPKCELPAMKRHAQFSPEFDKLVEIYKGLDLGLACLRPCCRVTYSDFDEKEKNVATKESKIGSESSPSISLDQRTSAIMEEEQKEVKKDSAYVPEDPYSSVLRDQRKRKKVSLYKGHPPMSKRVQLPCPLSKEIGQESDLSLLSDEFFHKTIEFKEANVPPVSDCTLFSINKPTATEVTGFQIMKGQLCLPCEDSKGNSVIGNVVAIIEPKEQSDLPDDPGLADVPGGHSDRQLSKSQVSENADCDARMVTDFGAKKKHLALDQLNCVFCQVPHDSTVAGPMMHYANGVPVKAGKKIKSLVSVHQHCAEWAPNVYYDGENAKNLQKEVARGQKLKCTHCGLKGAVLGCFVKSCVKSYHYPCALSLSCRWDLENYLVLCPGHVSESLPSDSSTIQLKNSGDEPNIIFETTEPELRHKEIAQSSKVNVLENSVFNNRKRDTSTIELKNLKEEPENIFETIEVDFGHEKIPQTSKVDGLENPSVNNRGSECDTKISEKIARISSDEWTSHKACGFVICGSCLSSTAQEKMALIARKTGSKLANTWNSHITHLIICTDERGAVRRTLKFMLATLAGIWILKTDWLDACISACQLVAEEPFEVREDMHGLVDGPRRARLHVPFRSNKLFEGMEFCFSGQFATAYKADLQNLISAAGGKVIEHGWNTEEVRNSVRIVIYYAAVAPDAGCKDAVRSRWHQAKSLACGAKAHAVAHTWLLDSVAAYEVQPL
ncbi:hypothetical protein KP509_16G078600 [Ceratopteris richardii]|uniref:Uncharacterized protein n=1 Tax=Ceratopteris richardii TaxID=49495 RepID=A0A8T2T087_CERRI|nr:hypothetical protein KP509_16G078600 [Ceratopteris richardii]